MQFRNTVRHFSLLAVLAVAFANVAVAQEFQILQARYGTAHRNIDVTQRLRQLAAADVTFRLSYRTFGDPAVGRAKVLRIFARGPRGANRIFEYHDNDVVDGNMFSGWGSGQWAGGNWNGGWNPGPGWSIGRPPRPGLRPPNPGIPPMPINRLQINSAKWGAGNQQVDVTGRLQSLISNGRLNIPVTNGAMAVTDPVPGFPKTLTVFFTVGNGRRQTRTVRENARLSLP